MFKTPFLFDKAAYFLTPSMGVSYFPENGHEAATLLSDCQTALSQARRFGGNSMDFYKSELSQQTLERLDLERN